MSSKAWLDLTILFLVLVATCLLRLGLNGLSNTEVTVQYFTTPNESDTDSLHQDKKSAKYVTDPHPEASSRARGDRELYGILPELDSPLPHANFIIDPNNPDSLRLIQLGIKPYVIKNWRKYLGAGGVVKDSSKVKEIYGMTSKQWAEIRSHIRFPSSSKDPKKAIRIEINTAQAEDWQSLRGIGPTLSQRIVKFRERLGGFVRLNQVAETYGISDSLFQSFKHQLYLIKEIKPLAINEMNEKELSQHPYISFKEARTITRYRDAHGPYATADDLLSIHVVNREWVEKLVPYLSFDTSQVPLNSE